MGPVAVLAALGDEEIPNYEMSDHEQLPFEPAIPRPQYAIFVRQEDVSEGTLAGQAGHGVFAGGRLGPGVSAGTFAPIENPSAL